MAELMPTHKKVLSYTWDTKNTQTGMFLMQESIHLINTRSNGYNDLCYFHEIVEQLQHLPSTVVHIITNCRNRNCDKYSATIMSDYKNSSLKNKKPQYHSWRQFLQCRRHCGLQQTVINDTANILPVMLVCVNIYYYVQRLPHNKALHNHLSQL